MWTECLVGRKTELKLSANRASISAVTYITMKHRVVNMLTATRLEILSPLDPVGPPSRLEALVGAPGVAMTPLALHVPITPSLLTQ